MTASISCDTEFVGQSLRPYQTLGRTRNELTVLVLDGPDGPGLLLCDGQRMVEADPVPCSEAARGRSRADVVAGDLLVDDRSGLRVMCTRGGRGTLTFGGRALRLVRQTTTDR